MKIEIVSAFFLLSVDWEAGSGNDVCFAPAWCYRVLVTKPWWGGGRGWREGGRVHSSCFNAGTAPGPQEELFQLQGEPELGSRPWAAAAAALHRQLLPRDTINRWTMALTASCDVIRKPTEATAKPLVAVSFMVLSSVMPDIVVTGTVIFFSNGDAGGQTVKSQWGRLH